MGSRRARVMWVVSVAAVATVVGVSTASALGGRAFGTFGPVPAVPGAAQPAAPRVSPALLPAKIVDDVYRSIAPCRIVQTKHAIAKGTTRDFHVRGNMAFTPQGGTSGGCGIPDAATSIVTDVTAFSADGNGALRSSPTGSTETAASFARFYKDRTSTTNPTLRLSTTTGGTDLTIHALKAGTKLSIEVTGFWEPPIEGLIYTGSSTTPGSGFVYSGSPRMLSVQWVSTGVADVTMDTDVTYCTTIAGAYYNSAYSANAKGFTKNVVRVFSFYTDASTHAISPVNNYVYLTVTC